MKKLVFSIICCWISLQAFSQKQGRDSILLSGIVFDADSSKPMTNVNISRHSATIGISDKNGYFEIYVNEKDTLVFSYVGFKESRLIVPAGLSNKEYYTSVALSRNVVTLKEVEIFPWPKESLKQALLNTNIEDKNLDNAKRNLNLATYQALSTPQTGAWSNDQIQKYYMQQFEFDVTSKDRRNALEEGVVRPTTQLLSTNTLFALILLARQIKKGELKQHNYEDYKQEKK